MLQIKDNQITLTSGDTVSIEVTIYTQDADLDNSELSIEDQVYTLQPGDKLQFIVLDINNDGLSNKMFTNMYNQYVNKSLVKPPILIKDFEVDKDGNYTNVVNFKSNDTKFINTGVYHYGVVLTNNNEDSQLNGQVNTVQSGEFILTQGFY